MQGLLWRIADLTGRVPIRLRFRQRRFDVALRQVPTSSPMVSLPRPRDVHGRGLRILVQLSWGWLGRNSSQRDKEQKRQEKRQDQTQTFHC